MLERPTLARLAAAALVSLAVAVPVGYAQSASPTASSGAAPSGVPAAKPHPPTPNSPEALTAELARTADAIARAKSDLNAVQGQVDAATTRTLIARAEQLQGTASGLQSGSDLAKAGTYARAAHEAANAAHDLMVAGVGGPLPSDANRPAPPPPPDGGPVPAPKPGPGGLPKPNLGGVPKPGPVGMTGLPPHLQGADQATIDAFRREQAGRDLRRVYDLITAISTTAQGNQPAEATELLTIARRLYRQGYEQYGTGQYVRAVSLAHAGDHAARAAENVLRAGGALPLIGPATPPPAPPAGW